jgi:hypothetical protein
MSDENKPICSDGEFISYLSSLGRAYLPRDRLSIDINNIGREYMILFLTDYMGSYPPECRIRNDTEFRQIFARVLDYSRNGRLPHKLWNKLQILFDKFVAKNPTIKTETPVDAALEVLLTRLGESNTRGEIPSIIEVIAKLSTKDDKPDDKSVWSRIESILIQKLKTCPIDQLDEIATALVYIRC